MIDFGTGAAAFDGFNTASSWGGLNSHGAIRIGLNGGDLLDGGMGVDTMAGGYGNDLYVVDDPADLVVEGANAGHDIVRSSVSYTLGANIEDLELIGTAAIDATGNGGQNTLRGNAAANRLDGRAGADMMVGGAGDDTYIVDNAGDVAHEVAGGGIDSVYSSVSYTLRQEVENLCLTGDQAINATGNNQDNVLVGNSAGNTLSGGAGRRHAARRTRQRQAPMAATATTSCSAMRPTKPAHRNRSTRLVVHARGTICEGVWPTMEVWIAGVKVQSFNVTSSDFAAYTVTAPLGMRAPPVSTSCSSTTRIVPTWARTATCTWTGSRSTGARSGRAMPEWFWISVLVRAPSTVSTPRRAGAA